MVYSTYDKSIKIPKSAEEFFRDVLHIRPTDSFEKVPINSPDKEFVHEHYDQLYNGINVRGAGYNFHFRNGVMYFAHGNYIIITNLNTNPTITDEDAKTAFADYKKIPLDKVESYHSEMIIIEITIENKKWPVLVYIITLIANHSNNSEFGIVDAHTGEVLRTAPMDSS